LAGQLSVNIYLYKIALWSSNVNAVCCRTLLPSSLQFIRKVLKKREARVSRYLAMDKKTSRHWTIEKEIPFKKPGGATRLKTADIDAALDASMIGKSSAETKSLKP